jgi:hypothetical protein
MSAAFANQIGNRNFLSPAGFRFTLAKEPKAAFFCNAVRIPEITLPVATQPSYLKDIDVPGEKLTYGDLTIKFLIDENLENYMAIHNWLTGLGFPESAQDFRDLITNDDLSFDQKEAFSDGVTSQGRSLFTILQEFIAVKYKENPSIELEKKYYREIFDNEYPNCADILPYFWMPKYTNATDPSARTLDLYKTSDSSSEIPLG